MTEIAENACFVLLKLRFGEELYWPEIIWTAAETAPAGLKVVTAAEMSNSRFFAEVTYSSVSFQAQFDEAVKMRQFLLNKSADIPEEFYDLVKDTCLLDDWRWWSENFLKVSEPEQIVREANWLWDGARSQYSLCVSKELLWLLSISRCLGLIEFEKLRQLRAMNITVLGASVAAMTIDLLVSLGCQNITFIDPGALEPSNLPRLPAGDITSCGQSKAQLLASQLSRRNPYGLFVAVHGKLIKKETERINPADELLSEYLSNADLIIEVIDDVKLKILAQQFAIKNNIPLVFIADVGNQPIVKFITKWTAVEKKIYTDFLKNKNPKQAPAAIYTMVEKDLPTEHASQFLLSCFGEVPFWSQTPVASRLSSGMAALETLNSIKIKGKTLQPLKNNSHIQQLCQNLLGTQVFR